MDLIYEKYRMDRLIQIKVPNNSEINFALMPLPFDDTPSNDLNFLQHDHVKNILIFPVRTMPEHSVYTLKG